MTLTDTHKFMAKFCGHTPLTDAAFCSLLKASGACFVRYPQLIDFLLKDGTIPGYVVAATAAPAIAAATLATPGIVEEKKEKEKEKEREKEKEKEKEEEE